MRIFEIILFEYILGYVLQGFAVCLGIYAFCVKKVEMRKYVAVSLIFIVISYVMRLLPVSFGVHTILNLACLFLLAIFFLRMPALVALRSILAITILLLVTELFSVFLITKIVGQAQFDSMMNDNLGKALIALPSSVIFAAIVLAAYFVLRKIKVKKSVKNGEGCA